MASVRGLSRLAMTPSAWNKRTRRLLLLTFPIAIPVWIAWVVVLRMAQAVVSVVVPIETFWTAEAERVVFDGRYHGCHGRNAKCLQSQHFDLGRPDALTPSPDRRFAKDDRKRSELQVDA